jgi:hypothetical protein
MKGKFKLLGHIGLALFVVSALILVAAPVAQAATEVEDVWVEFPSTDESGTVQSTLTFNKAATVLLWRIHFTPTTALKRGVDTITIQFYDGQDSTMGPTSTQDTYDVEFGGSVTTASNYDVDPDGPGTTYGYYDAQTVSQAGYRVTVTTPVDIAAGQEAWLMIDDASGMITSGGPNNTTGNTAAYKVKVYTSQDTTPVLSKGFYHGSNDVTLTAISVSPSTAGSVGQYIFTFNPAGTLSANTDTITVTFPYGTTVPSSMSASTVTVYGATQEDTYTCGADPVIDTDLRTVKVTVPNDISGSGCKITFATTANITNPTYGKGDYGEDDEDATNRIAFIRTNDEQLDAALDADSYSGYTITEQSAATLDFDYSAAPYLVTGLSDKYTMINMYSSKLYLQVEDEYGNLCDGGDTATAQVTLRSSSGTGHFYYKTADEQSYTQVIDTVTLSGGAKEIYYRDSTAGTYTLTAEYGSLDDATWTFQVCPGVALYDRYDNLIHTYAPTTSAPAQEVDISQVSGADWDVYKGGKYIDLATDAAVAYDVIVLGDGHYEVDSSTNDLNFGNSYLTIKSLNGADYTTIDGSAKTSSSASNDSTISTSGSNLTFDGLTISNNPEGAATSDFNRGIYLRRGAFTVQNCKFVNCPGDGIMLEPNAVITSGTITNNTFTGLGPKQRIYRSALWLQSNQNTSGLVITNNTFSNYTTYESSAMILVEYGGNLQNWKVSGNTISNCYYGIGTYDDITSLVGEYAIAGNTISDCTYGLFIGGIDPEPTFNFKNNTISGFTQYGVKSGGTTSFVGTNVNIQYNDITGTGDWAIYNTDTTSADPNCKYNWFGDATGPSAGTGTYASTTARGNGEAVTQGVTFSPWLHKPLADVIADNASYQAAEMKLVTGWNTLSTPVKLVSTADAIDELISTEDMEIGYYYDGGWQQITTGYTLSPCDAVYVKMNAVTYVLFKFDAGAFSTPSKDLDAGWNMISLAYLSSSGMNADNAVASVYRTADNLPGYSQVISPSLNDGQTDLYGTAGASWAYSSGQTLGDSPTEVMRAGLGYWCYMQNAATLAGFTITPIVPDLD